MFITLITPTVFQLIFPKFKKIFLEKTLILRYFLDSGPNGVIGGLCCNFSPPHFNCFSSLPDYFFIFFPKIQNIFCSALAISTDRVSNPGPKSGIFFELSRDLFIQRPRQWTPSIFPTLGGAACVCYI